MKQRRATGTQYPHELLRVRKRRLGRYVLQEMTGRDDPLPNPTELARQAGEVLMQRANEAGP